MKKANVCVYTTIMFRINGVEGEADEGIINEAQEILAREDVAERINTVIVDPEAKNLAGEVVHWQLDLDGRSIYTVSDGEDSDASLKFFEDHPLTMEPRPFGSSGDPLTTQAFKLIAELADFHPGDDPSGLIERAKELSR